VGKELKVEERERRRGFYGGNGAKKNCAAKENKFSKRKKREAVWLSRACD